MKNKASDPLKQMKVLFSAAPCGIVVYDTQDEAESFANDAYRTLFGPIPKETENDHLLEPDAIISADKGILAGNIETLRIPGDVAECTFRASNPNGQMLRVAATLSLVEFGDQRYIVSYFSDITPNGKSESAAIAQKEAAIKAYRQQLQIIDSVNEKDLVYKGRCNLTLNKTVYNQYADEERNLSFGEDYDENLEIVAQSATSASEASQILELFSRKNLTARFEQGATETSFTYMRKSHSTSLAWTEIRCHTLKIPDTDEIMCFAYAYDRSAQVLAGKVVKRLAEMEHDYLAVIDVEDHLVYMYNIKHEAEETNPRKTPKYEDDVAFAVNKVVVPQDRKRVLACMSLENIVHQLEENGFYSFSFSVVNNRGKVMRKALNYCYLDDSKRDVLMSRTDVTELYNAEQEQVKKTNAAMEAAQQASAAKSEFLSNMSHEIRTPMNAIMGLTQLAREELVGNDTVADYLENIEQSSTYLLSIINDILDMSRIESGKLEMDYSWVPQNMMLDSCIKMILPTAEKKHIALSYPKESNKVAEYEYRIDVLKTQRMLMNLLNNAVKFTPEGGHVSLTFSNLGFSDKISTDQIIVEDDGYGMSEEFLKRIFKPFEQERTERTGTLQGTGLGLALARQTARAMGGDITVESELGKGSKFTVVFPYEYRKAQSQSASFRTSHEEHATDLGGLHILLCEDNQVNALVAKKLLENRGCAVDWAENGKEGLDRFSDSLCGHYDVILMDVRMPKMDGLETTKAIRNLDREDAQTTAIIAMTANAFNEDREHCLEAGMNAYLTKPIDPKELYKELGRFFNAR